MGYYLEYLPKQKGKLGSMTSAKWWNGQLHVLIPHRNIEKQVQAVRTNLLSPLENRQNFTATKQMLSQEKGNFQTTGKFCGIFTHPCPNHSQFGHETATAEVPHLEPWPMIPEDTGQAFFTNACVCQGELP